MMKDCSQPRLLAAMASVILFAMEPVSWMTSHVPPCMIDPANYGAHYAATNECPPFRIFLTKQALIRFEDIGRGDPFTIFVVVLAALFLWQLISYSKGYQTPIGWIYRLEPVGKFTAVLCFRGTVPILGIRSKRTGVCRRMAYSIQRR